MATRRFCVSSTQHQMTPSPTRQYIINSSKPTSSLASRMSLHSRGFPTIAATRRDTGNDFRTNFTKGVLQLERDSIMTRPGYCAIQQQPRRLFSAGSSSSNENNNNHSSVKTSQSMSSSSSSSALQGPFKRVNVAEVRVAESLVMEVKRYEERHERVIREKATPEALLNMSLLEDELRGEMAVVLGRMDAKLKEKMKIMEEANAQVYAVLARPFRDVPALLEVVNVFNEAQEAAYQARLDLIIQRQSAGFVQNNYHLIMQRYPIPPKKRVRL